MTLSFENIPYKQVEGISYNNFLDDMKQIGEKEGNVSIDKFNKIIKFTITQCSFWHIQWLFSPANSPDNNAKLEYQNWKGIFDSFIDQQEEKVRGTKEIYIKTIELTDIKYAAEWNIEYNKKRPFRKFGGYFLGGSSAFLNKIGFKQAASKLIFIQLFPEWTVAHSQ
jgi:hypothetical protein